MSGRRTGGLTEWDFAFLPSFLPPEGGPSPAGSPPPPERCSGKGHCPSRSFLNRLSSFFGAAAAAAAAADRAEEEEEERQSGSGRRPTPPAAAAPPTAPAAPGTKRGERREEKEPIFFKNLVKWLYLYRT